MAGRKTLKLITIAAALAACASSPPNAIARDSPTDRDLLVGEAVPVEAEEFRQATVERARGRLILKLRMLDGTDHDGRMRLELKSDRDGFVHLYALNASGSVHLWLENVPVTAGKAISYPGDRLTVNASLPFGHERIFAVATRHRIDGFVGMGTTRRPHFLTESHTNFWQMLNGVLADLPSPAWGYASLRLDTTH